VGAIPPHIAARVSQFILVALSTDKVGEAAAAMSAARRALDGEKISIHDFANTIKNPGSAPAKASQQELEAAYQRGRTDERKSYEAKAQRGPDGSVSPLAMAQHLAANLHRVGSRHHEFIDNMLSRLTRAAAFSKSSKPTSKTSTSPTAASRKLRRKQYVK
jgi:hypothetical protein